MTKKIFSLILILAMVFSLAACGDSGREKLEAKEGYTIYTDDLGHEVQIIDNPENLSTVFAVATHWACMYGLADNVVSITQGNTRDFLLLEMFPQIADKKIVKGNNTFNFEELVSDPVPHVVFTNPEGVADEETISKLADLQIPVYVQSYADFEDQMKTAKDMGIIVGKEAEAQKYVDYYKKTVDLVEERVAKIPEKDRKTVYHAINEFLRTDKPGTISETVFDAAGAINVTKDMVSDQEISLTSKSYISVEELMQSNPEYIFINGGDVWDYIEGSPQYHNLQAYQNGNIYMLPLGVSRWGHPTAIETPLATLFVAKTLYPEQFEDIDIRKEVKYFYKEMFEYDLSEEQVDKIMGGRAYKEIKGGR